ncbi:MAG: hypothetical protein AB3N63_18310 [Puniceicoccaceae bacterium]
MKTKIVYRLFLPIVSVLCPVLCHLASAGLPVIKGIYGSPKPFWDSGVVLSEQGVNAIFMRGQSIKPELYEKARADGLFVFAEFATLNGKNYVDKHPEAWAINELGEKVKFADWFMGVCPTEPGFRAYRMNGLRQLLKDYALDGVWMDYVHWHAQFEEPVPILPETCFCSHCLKTFSNDTGIQIPKGSTPQKAKWILSKHETAWRDWRCDVIVDWAVQMKAIIKELRPDALLGIYHCPWDDTEFDGARRRILGLDYDLLKEVADVFSPMVYHERMGREAAWVGENLNWFHDRLGIEADDWPKVWPIVQAANKRGILSPEEFEIVLRFGLSGESSGVMMFTSTAVAEEEKKTAVMKKVYTGR